MKSCAKVHIRNLFEFGFEIKNKYKFCYVKSIDLTEFLTN